MKKNVVLCVGVCAALALTGCKSSESAYKKAYLKAQAQQENQQAEAAQSETPVVAPIVEKPVSQTTVVDNTDNAAVRSESVTLVSGAGLKNYSVVVGSFSLKANAEGLQGTLKSAGYDAQIVYNPSNNFYRKACAIMINNTPICAYIVIRKSYAIPAFINRIIWRQTIS